MNRKIEIDNEVWNFLKNHAEPFEDTPNTVLRRLLLNNNMKPNGSILSTISSIEEPKFPNDIPMALQQILEVAFLVICKDLTRSEATNKIAKKRGIAPQTVIDKYCRQLDKKAYEIDRLLEHNIDEFKLILQNTFSIHKSFINNFFNEYFTN